MARAGCGGDARKDRANPPPKITVEGIGSGELVDVGGRRLYIECIGSGGPTVLHEAGFGGTSQNWADVLPELGRTTRTCAYDRAGLGASDAIPGVHDAGDEIKDLERLLDRARIESPYVLVGHSYGGLLVRLFARGHADEVVITAAREREPVVVTRAIEAVVRAVRDEAPLPPCERLFSGPDVRCLS